MGSGAQRDGRLSPGEPARRLFVAVALPSAAREAVAGLVADVRDRVGERRSGVRWVSLDGLHLTLRFLGPTEPSRTEAVAAAIRETAALTHPIQIDLSGGGAFPTVARPRVLWLGVTSGADALAAVSADLEARLVEAGWPAEGRPFRPHLSLARADGVRAGPATASALVDAAAGFVAGWTADRLTLFESHTGAGPARYEPIMDVAIAG